MFSKEINDYVHSFIPERNELLTEMEQVAKNEKIPIMELTGMETLLLLLKIKKPRKILEIGTAIGYSAIRMAQTIPDAKIITVERERTRYEQALTYIARSELEDRIHAIFGDALEVSKELEKEGPYDVLFIDAAKGQYENFFQSFSSFLNEDGIILSDNVLFKGYVVKDEIDNKRLKSIANKLKNYNEWLRMHPKYETFILPIGDGIAVTLKDEKKVEQRWVKDRSC